MRFDYGSISEYLPVLGEAFEDFYLVGGTALSLAYLQHRLSYDIDLFCQAQKWDSGQLNLESRVNTLKDHFTVKIETKDETTDNEGNLIGRQYLINRGAEQIKLDLVRDTQPLISPFNEAKSNEFGVNIPDVSDLYFRKVLIALGSGKSGIGRMFAGGRLKARDILDIYTLSRQHAALSHFLSQQTFDSPLVVVNRLERFVGKFNKRTIHQELQDTKYLEYEPETDADTIKQKLLEEINEFRRMKVKSDLDL